MTGGWYDIMEYAESKGQRHHMTGGWYDIMDMLSEDTITIF